MNKIYSLVNERTGNKYSDLRFCEVAIRSGGATVTVVCPKDRTAEYSSDGELVRLINEICGFNMPVGVRFVAQELTAPALRECARSFTKRFPFVASSADDITATTEPPAVKLKMLKNMYELADDYISRLDEHLKNRFIVPVKIEVETVEYVAPESVGDKKREPKYYDVNGLTPVVGRVACDSAISAADVEGSNDGVDVCGVITMVTDFTSKDSGVKHSRPYTKFVLYDGESTLQCRFFPQPDGPSLGHDIINKPVCVFGNTKPERDRDEVSMTAQAIALCDAGIKVLPAPKEPKSYVTVRPAPYEEYVQASLFGAVERIPRTLAGTFVVFDFETTGLSVRYDKPTELGAVKIVDGVITETFSTLIDPRRPIPDDVAKKTGITDDMVRGKPIFEDILPDFYKFTYGCSLVGHNIGFDFPFLLKHGNRCGWTFGDRKTYDTMGMAPRALPGIQSLALDKVLEALGLSNDNAHRALSDATATAKAFIAMNKKLYD